MMQRNFWQHLKRFKSKSMFVKDFCLIFSLSAIVFLTVTLGVYAYYRNLTLDAVSVSNKNTLERVRDLIDLVSKDAERLSIRIGNDIEIKNFLKEKNIDSMSYETVEKIDSVRRILSSSGIANDYLYVVELYAFGNDYFITSNGASGKMSRAGILPPQMPENKKIWVQVIKRDYTDKYNLVFFQKLYLSGSRSEDGILAISIDLDALGKQIQGTASKNYEDIFLIDENNIVLYATLQSSIGESADDIEVLTKYAQNPDLNILKFKGRELFVTKVQSEYKKWMCVSFASSEQYFGREMGYLGTLFIVSVAISLIVAILGALWISARMFKPINTLLDLVSEKEAFDVPRKRNQSAEIEIIIREILTDYEQTNQIKQQLILKQIMLNQAQSIALQAQINPHFLYNTLENINWRALALTKGRNDVSDMIVMLSRLLRFYLKTENAIISIKDEISYAKLYMDILQLRFGDTYRVEWELDAELNNCKIVKTTLQPLLENAVNHGVSKGNGGDFIKVKGYVSENKGIIEIVNSGPPLSERQIADINSEMEKNAIIENLSIGMSNVNKRIKLHFSEEYGLRASLTKDGYTCISITFPAEINRSAQVN